MTWWSGMDKAYRPSLSAYWRKRYKPLGKFTQDGVEVFVGGGNAVCVAMVGVDTTANVGLVGSGCKGRGNVGFKAVP